MSEEITKRRPMRYFAPDGGVRPYSRLHAEGFKMLSELEKVCITWRDVWCMVPFLNNPFRSDLSL